jgi:hypothetical protein
MFLHLFKGQYSLSDPVDLSIRALNPEKRTAPTTVSVAFIVPIAISTAGLFQSRMSGRFKSVKHGKKSIPV